MLLQIALKGMEKHKEALLKPENASNPSFISENTHILAQYVAAVEERLGELEYDLELSEASSFNNYIESGVSTSAAKELIKRQFAGERATIKKTRRLVSSGWKLVTESQSRVKHLIAEANNQI